MAYPKTKSKEHKEALHRVLSKKGRNKSPMWFRFQLAKKLRVHYKLVDVHCMVCEIKFMDSEPQMCCSGYMCGCMGMPTEPIVCSKNCWDKLHNKTSEKI